MSACALSVGWAVVRCQLQTRLRTCGSATFKVAVTESLSKKYCNASGCIGDRVNIAQLQAYVTASGYLLSSRSRWSCGNGIFGFQVLGGFFENVEMSKRE
eukprot:scaffold902_cov147-Cylindrotheca_fusiformis.AAC.3